MVVKISRQPAHFTVYSDKHTSFSECKWQASDYTQQSLLCYFSHLFYYSQSFWQPCLLLELKWGSEKQRTPCCTLGCTQASSSGDLWTAVSTMVKFYLATLANQPSIRTFVFDNCPHLVCCIYSPLLSYCELHFVKQGPVWSYTTLKRWAEFQEGGHPLCHGHNVQWPHGLLESMPCKWRRCTEKGNWNGAKSNEVREILILSLNTIIILVASFTLKIQQNAVSYGVGSFFCLIPSPWFVFRAEQEILLRRSLVHGDEYKLSGRRSFFRRSKKGSHGMSVNHSREGSDSANSITTSCTGRNNNSNKLLYRLIAFKKF